jgi:hypothetical protein
MSYPFLKVGDKVRLSDLGHGLLLDNDIVLTDRDKVFTIEKVNDGGEHGIFFNLRNKLMELKYFGISELILVDLV